MFLKLTNIATALLIGTALTGCSTTSRTSSVHTTSTYYSPAYRPAPHTTIISKTKAYQGYQPKYAQAPSQNIQVYQKQKIKNKVLHNKIVQNNTSYPHTHPYAKPNTHHTHKRYTPPTPSMPAHEPYNSNAPYAAYEQTQINEAKRRSLETKAQEDAWNNRLDAADEHQMQQALMNSYETKAAEDAARSNSSWLDSSAHMSTPPAYNGAPTSPYASGNDTKPSVESATWAEENRQLQQAMDASLQTQATEDATRQQSLMAEENRQLQQAMDASLQTQATEDAARQQSLMAEENRQLQQAMDASLQTQATEDAARQQSLMAEENRQLQQAMDVSLQTQASIEQPMAPIAVEQPVVQPVMEQPVAWVPNEGIQVKAGEKLMELKRSNGGVSPSHADMKAHLQREMNLSDSESGIVLDEMGIE